MATDIQIRPIVPEEFATFSATTEAAFGDTPSPDAIERWRTVFEFDRSLAAFDGAAMVGTSGLLSLTLTTPGGLAPMAGVTAVGVLPSHRRRGILASLMRRQLDDIHDRGEPLAGLWASEGAIYGRFGYGLATLSARIQAERERVNFVVELDDTGSLEMVERDAALREIPDVFERCRPRRAGMLTISEARWAMDLADDEHSRHGASELFFVLHRSGGIADGYLTYRVRRDWTDGIPGGTLIVHDLLAETSEAHARLWGFAFAMDLMRTIEAEGRPADEPLMLMVSEPRRLRVGLSDAMYVRLVDVPAALEARRYGVEGSLVLDVRDAFCPWNEGRFELNGGPDGATCRPSTRDAGLTLAVADLGALYLGGTGARALESAGRIAERRSGAVDLAGRMFASDRAPWCPSEF
jgi:predicted acetyltransferase